MLDARLGDDLRPALHALPPRSGIILRPYAMRAAQRRPESLRAIRAIAHARRHILLYAGASAPAGYDGVHGYHAKADHKCVGMRCQPVHSPREARKAQQRAVDFVLISPVFATRSHVGAAGIGIAGFARLARQVGTAAPIALGGMQAQRFIRLRTHGAQGWAAIDAWIR